MHFELEHAFDAPVAVVEAAMFHVDYPAFLVKRHELLTGVAQLNLEDDGTQIRRRMHYAPRPVFEHIAYKKIPPHWFEFIDESIWDKPSRRLEFTHSPCEEKVRERLFTHGHVELRALSPTRTLRRTRTDIELKNLPFMLRAFGSAAEQMLAREAKRMFDCEAGVLTEWLASPRS